MENQPLLKDLKTKFLVQAVSYIEMAHIYGSFSEAQRMKVGAIIVSPTGRIVGCGFNGCPAGVDNTCEHEDAEGKLITHDHVIHAEVNAIFNATTPNLEGSVIYLTDSPCIKCASAIKHKKFRMVIFDRPYRDQAGVEFCRKWGVEIYSKDQIENELQER